MELQPKLLDVLKRAYDDEQAFVAELSAEERAAMGTLERWSAKDALAHIVTWKERLAQNIAAALRGETPTTVDDIDQANTEIFEANRGRSWADVLGDVEHAYHSLVEIVHTLGDDGLMDTQLLPSQNDRPLWRQIAGTGYTHSILHLAQYHTERGNVQRVAEYWQEAADRLMPLDDAPDWQGTNRYNLACGYALTGQPERAVAELRESLRLNPGLTEWSRQDSDLASLRDRPDYRALYADTAAPE